MHNPSISIIVPLFNKEKHISGVLDSIVSQSLKDFEVIVVDDGSTDSGASVVEAYRDDRIRLIKKANGGVSSARNYGLKYANAELVFYLDGDDKMEPNALSVLYDLYKRYPDCDIFTGNFIQVYPNIKQRLYCKGKREYIISDNYKDFYKQKFYMRTGIFMIKKEKLIESNGYNEHLCIGEDLEFFLRLLKKCKVVYTPICIFRYIKEASELSTSDKEPEKGMLSVIDLECFSGYRKKIYGEHISLAMFISIISRNHQMRLWLWKRYHGHLLFLLFMLPGSLISAIKNSQVMNRLFNGQQFSVCKRNIKRK